MENRNISLNSKYIYRIFCPIVKYFREISEKAQKSLIRQLGDNYTDIKCIGYKENLCNHSFLLNNTVTDLKYWAEEIKWP